LAESVFDVPKLLDFVKTQELLVTYRPKLERPDGLAGIYHALHFVIALIGTLELYNALHGQEKNLEVLESLFIDFSWGELRVQINSNPFLI